MRKAIAVLVMVAFVLSTAALPASAQQATQQESTRQQSTQGFDESRVSKSNVSQVVQILKSVADRNNNALTSDDFAKAHGMVDMLFAQFADTNVTSTIEANRHELAQQIRSYKGHVATSEDVAQFRLKMSSTGAYLNYSDEQLHTLLSPTDEEVQQAADAMESFKMVGLQNAIHEFLDNIQEHRGIAKGRSFTDVAFHPRPAPGKLSLCGMMGAVGTAFGIAGLFGCIPCGFASAVAGVAAFVCEVVGVVNLSQGRVA